MKILDGNNVRTRHDWCGDDGHLCTYSLELMSFLEVVFFQDDHRTLLCRRSVTTPGS